MPGGGMPAKPKEEEDHTFTVPPSVLKSKAAAASIWEKAMTQQTPAPPPPRVASPDSPAVAQTMAQLPQEPPPQVAQAPPLTPAAATPTARGAAVLRRSDGTERKIPGTSASSRPAPPRVASPARPDPTMTQHPQDTSTKSGYQRISEEINTQASQLGIEPTRERDIIDLTTNDPAQLKINGHFKSREGKRPNLSLERVKYGGRGQKVKIDPRRSDTYETAEAACEDVIVPGHTFEDILSDTERVEVFSNEPFGPAVRIYTRSAKPAQKKDSTGDSSFNAQKFVATFFKNEGRLGLLQNVQIFEN